MNTATEDICVWPDRTWCYRYELREMNHKSDDYETLAFASPEYDAFVRKEELQ